MIFQNTQMALRLPSWIRRIGVAGFLFFLVKGLAWLAVPVIVGYLV